MDTRTEIVYLADKLIRSEGYHAFSFGEISAIMDIRRAAVHYYFHSKSDLGNEVVRQESFRLKLFQRQQENLSGEGQLRHLFTIFYRNSLGNSICLMGSLLPEFTTFDDVMQDSVKRLCQEIAGWIEGCLEQGRASGRLSFKGTAADRALLVVSTLLSSLLMARVLGGAVFVRMADQLLQDLGAEWRVADLPAEGDPDELLLYSYTEH